MAIAAAPRRFLRRVFRREEAAVPSATSHDGVDVQVLTAEEAWALYDEKARKYLGMSADEFERAWDAGEFVARQEEPAVGRVIMLRSPKPHR